MYKILESVRNVIAVSSTVLDFARDEILWVLTPQMLLYSGQFGLTEKSRALIQKGGRVRGITRILGTDAHIVRRLLDVGEDVHCVDEYTGVFMLVADKKLSINTSAKQNINLERLSLDDRVMAIWTDDSSRIENLIAAFEALWEDTIDAKQCMQQLAV
jgi:hypothetical protein